MEQPTLERSIDFRDLEETLAITRVDLEKYIRKTKETTEYLHGNSDMDWHVKEKSNDLKQVEKAEIILSATNKLLSLL